MRTPQPISRCICLVMGLICIASQAYAVGPGTRTHPHRPNPPGPNNPIGPHNPAVSNPLSTLNPATSFSNNQIVLRQLTLPIQQNALPNAATPSTTNALYAYIPNASLGTTRAHRIAVPLNHQLLLSNRSVFSMSHPVVLAPPDPMTPFANRYTVIEGRYYAIDHDPANDASLYSNSGATVFNGSQMVYLGLGQELRFSIQTGSNGINELPRTRLDLLKGNLNFQDIENLDNGND